MTFQTLDAAYQRYRDDHNTAHELFTHCLTFAKDIVGENPDAEEIAHDSAWSAWQAFNTLRPETIFSAWFLRIVKNKSHDYRRKSGRRASKEAEDIVWTQPAFTADEQETIRRKAGKEHVVVNMMLQGHSLDDVAEALGVSAKTIRRRLYAAGREATNVIN